jgi:hypothetical protein
MREQQEAGELAHSSGDPIRPERRLPSQRPREARRPKTIPAGSLCSPRYFELAGLHRPLGAVAGAWGSICGSLASGVGEVMRRTNISRSMVLFAFITT